MRSLRLLPGVRLVPHLQWTKEHGAEDKGASNVVALFLAFLATIVTTLTLHQAHTHMV